MLLFAEGAAEPIPQVVTFPDHLDTHMLYYLPQGLVLAHTPTEERDFFLLRYHGDFTNTAGGLLHMQLALQPLVDTVLVSTQQQGWNVLQAGFTVGQFRLKLRSLVEGGSTDPGQWHLLTVSSQALIVSEVALTPHETEFLQALLTGGNNVIEIECDLRYQGLVAGMPWLVTAHVGAIKTQLAALLPDAPVSTDQIVAAFLSLREQMATLLSWRALETNAVEPTQDVLLREIALRSLGVFFKRQPSISPVDPPLYRLLPASSDDSASYSWDLLSYRQEERSLTLSWSISELYKELTDPAEQQKLFPVVSQVSPFAAVPVYVMNYLPFDTDYLKAVQVSLRYSGPTGVPVERSFTFPDQPQIEQFTVVYPAITSDFQLAYRITATLALPGGSGWPRAWVKDFVAADAPLVEVSRKTAGIDFVRVEAEAQVFLKASSLSVQLLPVPSDGVLSSPPDPSVGGTGTTPSTAPPTPPTPPVLPLAQLTLTSQKPAAWVALPGFDPASRLHVQCSANPPEGVTQQPYVLLDSDVENREVRIAAYQLEMLRPDRITITLDVDSAPHFAYVGVYMAPITVPDSDEGKLYSLTGEEVRTWPLFRESVFDPIRFKYRITYVAYDKDGKTLPITTTGWMTADSSTLVVRPPFVAPVTQP